VKQLILIPFLCFSLCASEWHGAVVDEAQNDTMFGANPQDMQSAFSDQRIQTAARCPENNANCSSFFANIMNTFTERVKINLQQQLKRWQETKTELEKERQILSNLPKKQIEVLAIEQEKLNKLKELRFNFEKQLKLEENSGDMLRTKSVLVE